MLELSCSLLEIIGFQTHYGVRVLISTQEATGCMPLFLPYCEMIIVHRILYSQWLTMLREHIHLDSALIGNTFITMNRERKIYTFNCQLSARKKLSSSYPAGGLCLIGQLWTVIWKERLKTAFGCSNWLRVLVRQRLTFDEIAIR